LPVTVVNPLTGAVYPANTQIPISEINPFAAAALGGESTKQQHGVWHDRFEAAVLDTVSAPYGRGSVWEGEAALPHGRGWRAARVSERSF